MLLSTDASAPPSGFVGAKCVPQAAIKTKRTWRLTHVILAQSLAPASHALLLHTQLLPSHEHVSGPPHIQVVDVHDSSGGTVHVAPGVTSGGGGQATGQLWSWHT